MPCSGSNAFVAQKMGSVCFGGKLVAMFQIADCRGAGSHCEGSVFYVEGPTVAGTNTSFEKSFKFYEVRS